LVVVLDDGLPYLDMANCVVVMDGRCGVVLVPALVVVDDCNKFCCNASYN
jgi:hypothetical protein